MTWMTPGEFDPDNLRDRDQHLISNFTHLGLIGDDKPLAEDDIQEFFQKEPCPYNHQCFKNASDIFDALKHESVDRSIQARRRKKKAAKEAPKPIIIPDIEFTDSSERRLTFNLVFSTLKYQRFLEDMLEDSSFFAQHSEFKEDFAIVMVILCDFKQRKFQLRTVEPGEVIDPNMQKIEQVIYKSRTKLNAALARSRIKFMVLAIDDLLPEAVRQNDKLACGMNLYCWVNNLRTTMRKVQDILGDDGYCEIESGCSLRGKTYYMDSHCSNLLVFSDVHHEFLEAHQMVEDGYIVIQDKSSCVGVHAARALINEGDDILHINLSSGYTTVHMASLVKGSDSVIYATGIKDEKHLDIINQRMEQLGANAKVKIIEEEFLNIQHSDERLKHIKVVLLTAHCSRSGIANPVNFIVNEAEDMMILRDLSRGQLSSDQLGDLVIQQNAVLRHALKFPRVQAVVYCTRSMNEAENDSVVTRCIEYVNMVLQKKTPFRVIPPVLPMTAQDIEQENPLSGKFLRYKPSNSMSGCFIACIAREADDPKEAAKDILARAAARGIITGVNTESKDKNKPVKPQANTPRIEKRKSSDKKQGNTPTSTPGRPITESIEEKPEETEETREEPPPAKSKKNKKNKQEKEGNRSGEEATPSVKKKSKSKKSSSQQSAPAPAPAPAQSPSPATPTSGPPSADAVVVPSSRNRQLESVIEDEEEP